MSWRTQEGKRGGSADSSDLPGKMPVRGMGMPVLLGIVVMGTYIWTINQTAIQGYAARSVEKEISDARAENQRLKISEAELRSLERIEAVKDRLGLVDIPGGSPDVSYIESPSPLALR